jgi:parallel beta-helix repeat protein
LKYALDGRERRKIMKVIRTTISILFLIFIAGYVYAADYYVQQSVGDDANPGDGWGAGHALATIGRGIELADANPGVDTIHVAAGTYNEHLNLVSDVTLLGGYPAAGGPTRDRMANPTYIDGGGTGRPVTINGVSNVTLDGFVIQNGFIEGRGGGIDIETSSSVTINDNAITNNTNANDWGGGIAVVASSITITNNDIKVNKTTGTNPSGGGLSFWLDCTGVVSGNNILGNTAGDNGGGIIIADCSGRVVQVRNNVISDNNADAGGGIAIGNALCVIDGNTIENNTATNFVGGGICVTGSGSNATIRNNAIKSNTCGDWGGGIALYGAGAVSITGNMIMGNTATGSNGCGGGISFFSTPGGSVTNNVITENGADSAGGGVCCGVSSPTMVNNTISGNQTSGSGGGIACIWSSVLTVLNTILWMDGPDEVYVDGDSNIDITYSDIQGGWTGEGNINADPLFVGFRDYHLQAGSPCIDAGTPSGAPPDDIEGNPRDEFPDMGAYEYQGVGTGSINGTVTDMAGNPIKFALVIAVLGETKVKAFTGSDGYYEIQDLEPGAYWVLCIKKSYKPGIRKAEVVAGEETTVNFKLREKPD